MGQRARLAVLLLVATLLPSSAFATLDDSYVDVRTLNAGEWKSADSRGTYRITSRKAGRDHLSSQIVAEWVPNATRSLREPRPIFTRTLVEFGSFIFGAPIASPRSGRLRVTLTGAFMYDPEEPITCVFDLTPGGVVETVKPCGRPGT